MNFAELIQPEAIKVLSTATSKKRLLHEIAELAQKVHNLPVDATVDALIAREALGPTGVGHGVALPHARIEGIDKVQGLFLLLDRPVDFDAVDRQPIDIAFCLFAPESAGVEHLKALGLVSRTLRDTAICSKLRSNPNPATLYTILTETAAEQAA